jgi:hypothetical protein
MSIHQCKLNIRILDLRVHAPMKMEQTQCSETSAIKHHTPENNPKVYTLHEYQKFYGKEFLFVVTKGLLKVVTLLSFNRL